MNYHHVQWGFAAFPLVVVFGIVLVPIIADSEDLPTVLTVGTVVIMLAMLGVAVYFSRLEVLVRDAAVTAAFGRGMPYRTFPTSDIVTVRTVRNRWWYGWGVRRIPNGWLYNVWGLDAVELALADGTMFRIGTNDPDTLLAAISLSLRS